jgi:hypothetical protein
MQAEIESGVSIKLVSLFESCPQQGQSSATSSTIYHFFFFTIPFYRFSQNLLFPPYRQIQEMIYRTDQTWQNWGKMRLFFCTKQ